MGDSIPIELNPSTSIEIDAAIVADGLGLEVAGFRKLMQQGKVSVLCERGVGHDKGHYRASFYHEGKRVRLVVDGNGYPVEQT
ncbi:MAG: DUF6522 family protein [Dokdonella sp.]